MKVLKSVALGLGLTLLSSAYANVEANAKQLTFTSKAIAGADKAGDADVGYHSVSEVLVEDLGFVEADSNLAVDEINKGLGEVIMTVEQLIAVGKKIWAIVEAGKPVVSTSFIPMVSVLPKVDGTGIAFYEMDGWQAPKAKKFRVVFKNAYGMEVVTFTYMVQFQFGGKYKNKGNYLTGVTVTAPEVSVAWGFNFDAASSLMSISNRGTNENPEASATLEISYKAKSVLREIRSTESFYVTGAGSIQKL